MLNKRQSESMLLLEFDVRVGIKCTGWRSKLDIKKRT